MALLVYLVQNSSATHPDEISIKCEDIQYPIRRPVITTPLPGGSILSLDLGRFQQDYNLTSNLDEDLEELFIRNVSGVFTASETIRSTSGWDATVTPVRANEAVWGTVEYDVSGPTYTEDTTDANDAGANDMDLFPAASGVNPQVNDSYYIGSFSPCGGYRINVGTAGVKAPGSYTLAYEYSQGSSNWAAHTNVTDGTVEFTIVGLNNVTFDVPVDWVLGTVFGISAYWTRFRISAATTPIGVRPLGTQVWTLSTPAAHLITASSDRLVIANLGHGDNDFFVHGETITGDTSGVTATVHRPLGTFHRWEQIARYFYSVGTMTLNTGNDSYTVNLTALQMERRGGQQPRYEGKISFTKAA